MTQTLDQLYAIHRELISHDEVFGRLSTTPMIVNDLSSVSQEDKQNTLNKIYTQYSSDLISNLPSCACGEITGKYNAGMICPNCTTVVTDPHEKDVESILWFRAPEGIDKFIMPEILIMLTDIFTHRGGYDFIRWIVDPQYSPARNKTVAFKKLENSGLTRGYNNFVRNFFPYMEILFSTPEFGSKKKNDLRELLYANKDKIFSTYLPVPNKALLIIDKTNLGNFLDPIILGVVDAVNMFTSIDSDQKRLTVKRKESKTVQMLWSLRGYYKDMYKNFFSGRNGVFREHVYGWRSNFSARSVISSITNPHQHTDIVVPWYMILSLLRYHILPTLMQRGMSVNDAHGFITDHAYVYNDMLAEICTDLIDASKRKDEFGEDEIGLTVLMCRNPSLERLSTQCLNIRGFWSDVKNTTIGISDLILKAYNADFDGDEMSLVMMLDQVMGRLVANLKPYTGAYDVNHIRTVSSNLAMPKTVVSTIGNWFHFEESNEALPVNHHLMASLT